MNSGVWWHPPLHMPFALLYIQEVSTGVECSFSLSLSTILSSCLEGAVFFLGPVFPHRRLDTLFMCPRNEELIGSRQVRGTCAFPINFVRVFCRQGLRAGLLVLQFLWLLDISSFETSSLSLGGGSRMTRYISFRRQ